MASIMGYVTSCITLLIVLVPSTLAATKTVVGSDPRGGFWGAYVDPQGTAATATFSMYPDYDGQAGGVSYDPSTGYGLYELYEPHRLADAPVCGQTRGVTPRTLLTITDAPMDEEGLGACVVGKVGGFTIFESRIYFLYFRECMSDTAVTQLLQVRRFQSCDECGLDPAAATELSMLKSVECSEQVVDVFRKSMKYEELGSPVRYELGKVLKVVKKNRRNHLVFYFQVGKVVEESDDKASWVASIIMYKATNGGQATEVMEQRLDRSYEAWDRRMAGAVDVMGDLLCWSTMDRIWCHYGDKTELVLTPTQAIGTVCKGTNTDHLTDISGIVILESGDTKSLLFGCSAQTADTGGAGLLVMRNSTTTVTAVMSPDDRPVFGGGLALIDSLQSECAEIEPQICRPLPKTTASPTVTTTAEAEVEPEPGRTTHDPAEPEVEPEASTTQNPEPGEEPETGVETGPEVNPETEEKPEGDDKDEIEEKEVTKNTDDGSSGTRADVWPLLNFFLLLAAVLLR